MKRYLIIFLAISIAVVLLTGETVWSKTKDELGVVIDRIVKVLKYGGMTEKADAVTALGMIGDPRAVEPLIEFLKYSKRDHLRSKIAEALGRIGDKKATPALIKALLNDSYCHTRCNAAKALGKMDDKRAIPALKKALKDKYSYTRSQAAQSLKKITGKDYSYEKGSPLKEVEEMMKKIKETEKKLPKQK